MAESSVRQRKGNKGTPEELQDEKGASWRERRKLKEPSCSEIVCKVLWRSFLVLLVVVVGLTAYLYSIESTLEPVSYRLPPYRPLEGVLKPNTLLQNGKKLFEGEIIGPESLAMCNGKMYTGTYDGKVVRIDSDTSYTTIARFGKEPCGSREYEHTCGRPLGLKPSGKGTLYVIDGYFGLYEVDCETGQYEQLLSSKRTYDGKPLKFLNDVQNIPSGDIFFTDSDFKWERRDFPKVVAESAPNGRLLWYNPVNKLSDVAVKDLHFANGIELSPDGDFLLICETTRFRIMKFYLEGDKAGELEVFTESLPGPPDNIRRSHNGGYWVGFAGFIRKSAYEPVEFISDKPFLRSLLYKLISPAALLERLPKYGMIVELDRDGEIIRSLQDPSGKVVASVSEVMDTGDALYLGSYHAPFLMKLDLKSNE